MLYMLDTDIVSYLIKGAHSRIELKLSQQHERDICISAITRAELLYGLKRLDPGHRVHKGVRGFLNFTRVMPWPTEAAENFANVKHQLTLIGQPIGELDIMIAAHAMTLSAVLVTNNTRHFSRHWP